MPLTKKQNIIIAVVVAVFVLGLIFYTLNLLDPMADVIDPLAGLFLPAVKINDTPKLDDKVVNIGYTDDNYGETLIIKSDKAVYDNFSSAEVYFSVTNDRIIAEQVDLLFWFPGEDQSLSELKVNAQGGWEDIILSEKTVSSVSKIKKIGSHVSSKVGTIYIGARDTKYLKAKITFRPQTQGEFFIEAFGNRGGYGSLE